MADEEQFGEEELHTCTNLLCRCTAQICRYTIKGFQAI